MRLPWIVNKIICTPANNSLLLHLQRLAGVSFGVGCRLSRPARILLTMPSLASLSVYVFIKSVY